jgi:hypothetical protein
MEPRLRYAALLAHAAGLAASTGIGAAAAASSPSSPFTTAAVRIDPAAVANPSVSSLVFGANCDIGTIKLPAFGTPYPTCRWGGNAVTRYNYISDVSNHASDWFFLNEGQTDSVTHGNSLAAFLSSCGAAGSAALVTLPTIGWVACSGGQWGPRCADKAPGFSVFKYNYAPQATECTASGNASWCDHDAGNGLWASNSSAVTGNDPLDTSVAANASFAVGMAAFALRGVPGAPPAGAIEFALDNEPQLWKGTHRDVHPLPTTYDELWNMTLAYGSALKAAFPDALVHGPIPWGWCAYWSSAADNCVDGPDRAAHGGTPILQWLLQRVAEHKLSTGVQVLDVLDVHYYPQAPGVQGGSEDSKSAANRLAAVLTLYNETFLDGSWVDPTPVALLPRLKGWVAAAEEAANAAAAEAGGGTAAGVTLDMKYAISEYSFGNDGLVTTTLAHAEALAVMAREGVYQASVWGQPAVGGLGEQAFKLCVSRFVVDAILYPRIDLPYLQRQQGTTPAKRGLVFVTHACIMWWLAGTSTTTGATAPSRSTPRPSTPQAPTRPRSARTPFCRRSGRRCKCCCSTGSLWAAATPQSRSMWCGLRRRRQWRHRRRRRRRGPRQRRRMGGGGGNGARARAPLPPPPPLPLPLPPRRPSRRRCGSSERTRPRSPAWTTCSCRAQPALWSCRWRCPRGPRRSWSSRSAAAAVSSQVKLQQQSRLRLQYQLCMRACVYVYVRAHACESVLLVRLHRKGLLLMSNNTRSRYHRHCPGSLRAG